MRFGFVFAESGGVTNSWACARALGNSHTINMNPNNIRQVLIYSAPPKSFEM
jgi:hypothetical protein